MEKQAANGICREFPDRTPAISRLPVRFPRRARTWLRTLAAGVSLLCLPYSVFAQPYVGGSFYGIWGPPSPVFWFHQSIASFQTFPAHQLGPGLRSSVGAMLNYCRTHFGGVSSIWSVTRLDDSGCYFVEAGESDPVLFHRDFFQSPLPIYDNVPIIRRMVYYVDHVTDPATGQVHNVPQIAGWEFTWIAAENCPAGESRNPDTGDCESSYRIKLSPAVGSPQDDTVLTSIEPGKTTTLVAQVYDKNNQLVPNVGVKLKVDVVTRSGSHDHGEDGDDRHVNYSGKLSPVGSSNGTVSDNDRVLTGNTDTTGLFFQFASPAFPNNPAGDHEIMAECTGGKSCTPEGPKQVRVGIKGLVEIPASISLAPWNLIGSTATHPKNHYLSPEAMLKLIALASYYYDMFPNDPPLQLNDASLERGGLFDLFPGSPAWKTPHRGHRKGVIIDVRANGTDTAIPQQNFEQFQALLDRLGMSAFPEHLNGPNGHYHTRLLGVEQ